MFDTELALDTLSQIKDILSMIMARTSHIHKVDDFYKIGRASCRERV